MLSFLRELTDRAQLILLFEDVHWADHSTLDLLGYFTARFDTVHVLIVVTNRPDELQQLKHPFRDLELDLRGQGVSKQVPLEFLSQDAIVRYLGTEYPGNRFPPSVADRGSVGRAARAP